MTKRIYNDNSIYFIFEKLIALFAHKNEENGQLVS